ncbi:hypothetical protein V6N13_047496 [Hibiscus sabdariffa]|uniref:Uncharacterized protein n=1 Tax=Hibiscus sabdariffa TaxID=183260 RepID=A0ABR2F4C5_9ROSI
MKRLDWGRYFNLFPFRIVYGTTKSISPSFIILDPDKCTSSIMVPINTKSRGNIVRTIVDKIGLLLECLICFGERQYSEATINRWDRDNIIHLPDAESMLKKVEELCRHAL